MQTQLGPTIHIMVILDSHFMYLMMLHIFHKYSMADFKPVQFNSVHLSMSPGFTGLLLVICRVCDLKMASMISKISQ